MKLAAPVRHGRTLARLAGASWVPQDNSAWHGFAKMAEEHEQIPHAIERRQQQDSRAAD